MDEKQLWRFFETLRPRLEMARKVDEELNSQLAYRFNVLDYIRTSELGLSRVIADLLDPRATHGQRALFLDIILRGLQRSSRDRGRPLRLTRRYGENEDWRVVEESVDVQVERTITTPDGPRRLDVSVEFTGSDEHRRCLAIENKPYAGDQPNQIGAYLRFMKDEYGHQHGHQSTNHLLIYLSPTGNPPSSRSLNEADLRGAIKECNFAVMGYSRESVAESGEDENDTNASRLLLDYSLADWFSECRRQCDVERLRNFLRDADTFCRQTFGGVVMTDTTHEQMRQFLRDTNNMKIAMEVSHHWPDVRAGIKKSFAARLAERILARLRDDCQLGDLQCENRVTGHDGTRWQDISVYRHGDAWRVNGHQVSIKMQAQRQGTEAWIIGIATGDQLAELRDALKVSLPKSLGTAKASGGWPWYEEVRDRWGWWNRDVADLAREQEKDGEATLYFVERFAHICSVALPIIDETIHRYEAGRLWRPDD